MSVDGTENALFPPTASHIDPTVRFQISVQGFLPTIGSGYSKPHHTPQIRSGVYPTYHRSPSLLVVPVFPAHSTNRLSVIVEEVPRSTAPCNSLVIRAAVSSDKTTSEEVVLDNRMAPSAATTR